jgi:hypothetical protein
MGKGIGGFISSVFGSENEEKAAAPTVDPNAYNYGGTEGGADEAANRYQANARYAQQRTAAQADYGQANASTRLGLQARGDMNTVGQAQLSRALGQTPSIAQMQADRQMQQAGAAQAAQAASARGPGGLALAQQNAANNTANAQGAISGQAQVNAANERMQAEQAAAGTFGNMQQLDMGRTGQAAQMAQYQSTNQMQQRGMNDALTMGMTQAEMGVRGMQLGASQNMQAQRSANSLGAAGINAGVGGQNASMNQSNGIGVTGMASNFLGGYAGGGSGNPPGKADGGPVEGDKPYIVGERGPELVVPKKDAVVIPAERTAPMLSRVLGQDQSQMRDGPSDPRAYNMDKTFHRDTPQDQARVKKGVEDAAAREAEAMMAGYKAALAQGPSVAARPQETPDLRLAARADGGPLDQGQTALVGERGPELVVPQLSTWGAGGQDTTGARQAIDDIDLKREHIARINADAARYVDPYQQVVNREKAGRAAGLAPSENDGSEGERLSSAAEERYAKQMVRRRGGAGTAQAEEKPDPAEREAVAEGKAVPKRGVLSNALGTVGNAAQRMSASVDTAYHGPSAHAGPQLIPVGYPGRAMGGPVAAGQPYMMGEQGPEIVAPSFKAMPQGGAGASPSANALGANGGMDVLGSLKANSAFATKFQRDPTGGMIAGAREEGGLIDAGKKYLVGEKGPEAVVPAPPPGQDMERYTRSQREDIAYKDETSPEHRWGRRQEEIQAARAAGTIRPNNGPETLRYTREQRDDIKNGPPVVPLSAFLSRIFGGR